MPADQSYAKHRRYVLGYHAVLQPLVAVFLVWAVWALVREPALDRAMNVVLAAALVTLTYLVRSFPLTVQDRVIRLEERARLARLLPEDLQGRIGELGKGQLVALRFASDGELADLTRRVLNENIWSQDAIKRLIKEWRPDYLRA